MAILPRRQLSNMNSTVQRVLIVAVLVVSVILVIRSFTAPVPQAAPPAPPLAQVPLPPPMDPALLGIPPEIAALFPPGEAAPRNPDATWVAVGEFNGQEAGRTPTFELSGNTARIRYKVDGDLPFFAVFFVPANQAQAA